MPLHPQGPKPCTLNETESAASVYIKVVKHPVINHNASSSRLSGSSSYKSISLASKCPQRISFVSVPERDVTYTPSWSKLRPEVSQYNAEINVP
jgi:hypothetical protein